MKLEPYYSDRGKFYRNGRETYVSTGTLVSQMTGESFEHVPLDTLVAARLEGIGAHRLACDFMMTMMGAEIHMPPKVPADYPYNESDWNKAMVETSDALGEFVSKHHVEPVAVEQRSICKAYGFAGQPDLKCWLTWKGRRYMSVPDYKRVAAVTASHLLKVTSYLMLDGYKDCRKGFILWFKKGGGWQLIPVEPKPEDHAAICGQAVVLRWQMNRGLLKP